MAALSLAVGLGGCASLLAPHGALNEEKAATILADDKAIVLARLTADKDDEPFDAINAEPSYTLTLVNLTTGDVQNRRAPFRSPSPEDRKEGWVYFAIDPGSYFLEVDPPISTTGPSGRNQYRFTVAAGRVEYVGSFHANCATIWGILERGIKECSLSEGVADETELARMVAGRWLIQADAFRMNLARSYGAQASVEELLAARPAAVATTAMNVWREPDWDRLGEESGPPLIGAGDLSGLGSCYPPVGCGALIVVGLVVLGAVELVDAIDDAATQEEWEPCIKSLAEKMQSLDLSWLIWKELAARATPGGLAPESVWGGAFLPGGATTEVPYKSVLHINVQRVNLTDCAEPLSVCVKLAIRATLVASDTGKTFYDVVHLCTGPLHVADHAIWERPVTPPAECHSIREFCGDQGWPLLQEEIRKGVAELASAVMTDLLLAGNE